MFRPGLLAGEGEGGRAAQRGSAGRADHRDDPVVELGALILGHPVNGRALAVAPGESPVGLAVGYRYRDLECLPPDNGEPSPGEELFAVRVVGSVAGPGDLVLPVFEKELAERIRPRVGRAVGPAGKREGELATRPQDPRTSATAATGSGMMC